MVFIRKDNFEFYIVSYFSTLILSIIPSFYYIMIMANKESISIRVKGKVGQKNISPDLIDISDIKDLMSQVENMLFPGSKKNRAQISYKIEEGSVLNTFTTSRQEVVGFNALLADVQNQKSIDILEYKSALAFESLQMNSDTKNLTYEITTSVSEETTPFVISPKTAWKRSEETWVEAEFYVYGEITDAGGKNNSNIHVDTKDHGILTIATDKLTLKEKEENMLYRTYGVRVKGKQHLQTGEMDTKSLQLIELIDIQEKYDQDYLETLIDKATPHWKGLDADAWLGELRGDYE